MTNLIDKIEQRTARIVVVGLGYVGLPLAVEFASAGFPVTGYDKDNAKIDLLNKGISYIDDISSAILKPLLKAGLKISSDPHIFYDADCIIVCVPTPLNKTKEPDMQYILSAINEISLHQHPDMLIVLESTSYPGTTREVFLPKLSNDQFILGENFFLAFSPERIDPGNKTFLTANTPKIIGGVDAASGKVATKLYSTIIKTIVPVSNADTAEMVKLLENTFRAVNIGLVNEIAIMSNKLGIDVWEVIRAAATKPFGFMPFFPGPGLGGHCIPIDPLYLSWKMRMLKYQARFIELADTINSGMPAHVIGLISRTLNDSQLLTGRARKLVQSRFKAFTLNLRTIGRLTAACPEGILLPELVSQLGLHFLLP